MEVKRFHVFLVSLDPAIGYEIKKTRPAVVISPDEMNSCIGTVIVAPMTTRTRGYPTRPPCKFRGKQGEIALDQLRTIDKSRLVKRLGVIDDTTASRVLGVLQELFAQ